MRTYRFALIFLIILMSPLYAQGKTLKVGVSLYDPPFVLLGANNQFFGFDIVLMQHICKAIKYSCKFVPMPFNELLKAAETGQVDLAVSSIIITPEREKRVQFSFPYQVSKTRFLAVSQHHSKTFSIQSLANKKIGVPDEVFAKQLSTLGISDKQIVVFDRDDTLVQGLDQGKIDFALLDNPSAMYWQEESSGHLEAVGKPMTYGRGLGIAISPSNVDLLQSINKALLEYQNSDDYIDAYKKYLSHFAHAEENEQ